MIQSGSNNRKTDVFRNISRDNNQRRIQNPAKHQPLTIFAKHFILFVSQANEYASDKTKQNPGVLSFISQKIRTAISANLFLNSILSSHYYLAVRH